MCLFYKWIKKNRIDIKELVFRIFIFQSMTELFQVMKPGTAFLSGTQKEENIELHLTEVNREHPVHNWKFPVTQANRDSTQLKIPCRNEAFLPGILECRVFMPCKILKTARSKVLQVWTSFLTCREWHFIALLGLVKITEIYNIREKDFEKKSFHHAKYCRKSDWLCTSDREKKTCFSCPWFSSFMQKRK